MPLVTTTFFCGLDQISIPMTSRNGERYNDVYYITRDSVKIQILVRPVLANIGSVEANYLMHQAKAVIYRNGSFECETATHEAISQALDQQLIEDMKSIKVLDRALWMIKDNACHFDRAWITGTIGGLTVINNNVWASHHSCADGTFREVAFSSDEMKLARSIRRPVAPHLNGTGRPTVLGKGSLRYERFEYFIAAARATIDVAVKIAEYCSGLEALVSTSQQELSHQVSERVASVLAGPGNKRIAIYKIVKKAYGFRSKTVHGASFKPAEVEQLRDCARDIDDICRALNVLYWDEDEAFRSAVEGSDQTSTDFFMEAILGTREVKDLIEL